MYDDDIAWEQADPEDRWIYDKLALSQRLGYRCGPAGINVPYPGTYIVRPRTNLQGMGRDAGYQVLVDATDHLPENHFWCELFTGRHLTVDYIDGEQVNCFEGYRHNTRPLYKWNKWVRQDVEIPYPMILGKTFKYVNCEFIGDKLIEVHLRLNPDARYGSDVLIPVWERQDNTPPDGMVFVEDPDYHRLGFFIRAVSSVG